MTPLIRQGVSYFPDEAADYQWFDLSDAYKPEVEIDAEVMSAPIPFPMTAVVCTQSDGVRSLLLAKRFENYTGVLPYVMPKDGTRPIALMPFAYKVEDGNVLVNHSDGSKFDYKTSPTTGVVAFMAIFLKSLQMQSLECHTPIRRANHDKRVRQKKVPMYDWKTIVIEPSKTRGDSKGGTHASPRQHERRGHFRKTKKGPVWVKNCTVGDASKGAVFHDYKFKESA